MWTPPHFWALSLYTSEDYAKAGVPMMPVVKGAASTRRQILIYSLVFVPLCLAPAFTGLGGPLYLAVAALGGAGVPAAGRAAVPQPAPATAPSRRNDDGLYDVKAGRQGRAQPVRLLDPLPLACCSPPCWPSTCWASRPLELLAMSDPCPRRPAAGQGPARPQHRPGRWAWSLFVILVFVVTIVRLSGQCRRHRRSESRGRGGAAIAGSSSPASRSSSA